MARPMKRLSELTAVNRKKPTVFGRSVFPLELVEFALKGGDLIFQRIDVV